MSRGQESAEYTLSTSAHARGLPKEAFIDRADRAAHRWGQRCTKALLEEWIKQGLIAKGDRGPNRGRSPTYVFGQRHFRRALQLLRLRADGFSDRDSVLVQLFLRGYGVRPTDVVEELLKEARRARAMINAPIRSVHADRTGPIPPARRRALLHQIGEQDQSFVDAGLAFDPDDVITITRAARSPGQPDRSPNSIESEIAQLFAGTLDVTGDAQSEAELDELVRRSLHLFEDARAWLQAGRRATLVMGLLARDPAVQRAALSAFAAMYQREFAPMNFIVTIKGIIENRAIR